VLGQAGFTINLCGIRLVAKLAPIVSSGQSAVAGTQSIGLTA